MFGDAKNALGGRVVRKWASCKLRYKNERDS